jgi:putative lipoic acid-binding regulatory protein
LSIPSPPFEDFYSSLKEKLQQSQSWPGLYLFKFIVKTNSSNLTNLKSLFEHKNALFSEKKSSKNAFLSLSVRITMKDPEEVISIYKKVSLLKGVIVL